MDITYIIVAFFCGLVPTLLTLWLNEKVKGSVKNSFDEKLAQFQIELNHLKSKENFKFTKLHEKRLVVLETTFKYLNESLQHLQYYISPVRKRDEDNMPELDDLDYYLNYHNSQDEFFNYFLCNQIYFSQEIGDLLSDYFSEADKIFLEFEEVLKDSTATKAIKDKNSLDARGRIKEKILPIRSQIEDKFRELLGN